MRVAIDARLVGGVAGGVEGVVQGLAAGLSGLSDENEYLFISLPGHDEWLRPFVGGNVAIVPMPGPHPTWRSGLARARGRLGDAFPTVRSVWRRRPQRRSDAFVEGLRPDVIHFPFQRGFTTPVPNIYHPHDLQHVHLPEMFTAEERAQRERWYASLCRSAALVAVSSYWTKVDVEQHFQLPPGRVRVVPLAPPLLAVRNSASDDEAKRRYHLPTSFLLYPAQTWPHKNHANLLRAIARVRDDSGLAIPVVFTGLQNSHFAAIEPIVAELGLTDLVTWLGFVPAADLIAIYRLAGLVAIPSRFEAASGPLWEAFALGIPAICSNVTSLPEQAGDAALLFDPLDVPAIADALSSGWTNPELRSRLVKAGRLRVAGLSWDRTARHFRAHYRRLAARPLTEEDRSLLEVEPRI